MITDALTSIRLTGFTPAERRILRSLRARYDQDRDLFSRQELARLRFLRWLYRTSRLTP